MNKENSKATTFDRNWRARVLKVLLAVIAFCLPAFGQTIDNKQVSSLHLSGSMRKRLLSRFELFTKYEKEQSYDKQFDLLAKDHLATLLHMNVDRQSYVKFRQDSQRGVGKLIDLTVTRIKRNPDDPQELGFSAIAKLQKEEREYSAPPICVAPQVNGDWRFLLLYVEY